LVKYEPEVSAPALDGIVNMSELAPEARTDESSVGVVAPGRIPEVAW
jgi:hypothetical protein